MQVNAGIINVKSKVQGNILWKSCMRSDSWDGGRERERYREERVRGRERERERHLHIHYELWISSLLVQCVLISVLYGVWYLYRSSLAVIVCVYVKHGKQKWLKIQQRENLYMRSYLGALWVSTLSLNSEWIQKLICDYLFLFLP